MAEHHDHTKQAGSVAIAVGGIWIAVLAVSLFSPDMVSGSEQQHLPVAAFGTWLWGMVATVAALSFWLGTGGEHGQARLQLHRAFAVGIAAIWAVTTGASIFGPVMVTGTDPTRIPVCALVAPMVAAGLTVVVRAGVGLAGLASRARQAPAPAPATVAGG
jgi:hypothetical protein